ncbi:MAG: hypothetical protein IPF72_19465 [Chitinophagaceae bacterium]|nr:hypothetical protein [Chitinophagaceae bacterium]
MRIPGGSVARNGRVPATAPKVFALVAGNVGIPYTAGNPIIYDTVIYDSHTAYSTVTGQYTVPEDGIYRVTASYGGDVANNSEMRTALNGTDVNGIMSVSLAGGVSPSGSVCVSASLGDTLEVRLSNNFTSSVDLYIQLSIEKIL